MDDQRGLAAIVLVMACFLFWLHTQGKLFALFGLFGGSGANSAGIGAGPKTQAATADPNDAERARLTAIINNPSTQLVEKLAAIGELAILNATIKPAH